MEGHIFLSYSKKDQAKAKQLADSFEEIGWDVWWDKEIPPGKTYDDIIQAALDQAVCIVVLWSKDSVKSQWVRTEAAEGKGRQILIPIKIEDVETLPLEFRLNQAASLVGWDGDIQAMDFRMLVSSMSTILPKPTVDLEVPITRLNNYRKPSRKINIPFKSIAAVIVIALLGVIAFQLPNLMPKASDPVDSGSNSNGLVVDNSSANPNTNPGLNLHDNSADTPDSAGRNQSDTNTGFEDKNWFVVKAKPSLTVRSKPSRSGKAIGKISNGGKIKVVKIVTGSMKVSGKKGRWVEVRYKRKKGYVFSAYLQAVTQTSLSYEPFSGTVVHRYRVKASPHLNIRKSPDVTGKIIKTAKKGAIVTLVSQASGRVSVGGRRGYWVKIKYRGKTGYVFDAFLEKIK